MSSEVVDMNRGRIDSIERKLRHAHNGSGRIAVLRELAADGIRDPEYVLRVAGEGYHEATKAREFDAAAEFLHLRGVAQYGLSNYDAAIRDLSESFALAHDLELHEPAARTALALGRSYADLGDHRNAIDRFAAVLDLCGRHDMPGIRADALESLGGLRTNLGEYAKALGHYFESLAVREAGADAGGAGRVLMAIGVVDTLTGNLGSAFDRFTAALGSFRGSGDRYREVTALMHLGQLHFDRGELVAALDRSLTSIAIYESLGDRLNLARALSMVGGIHERSGRMDEALDAQMKAYELLSPGEEDGLALELLLAIGRLNAAGGALQEAMFVFKQALGMARDRDDPRMQYEFHRAISDVYEKLERPAKALEHFKRYTALRESMIGLERQKEMAEQVVRYELERAEREREIYRLRVQHLETEVRLKQNELTALALNLVQKKELLEELESNVESLRRAGAPQGGSGQVDVDHILRQIRSNKSSDGEWKAFEQQLDNLHQDFIRRLSERYTTLTPAELKVCSLTRLDLQAKDIANLLFASVRTIHAHKYNIRRKLTLPSDVSLTTFLVGV